MTDPHQYCRDKAAASGSSLHYSLLFLPPEVRDAVIALHAYCREIDDVVDECSDPGVARTKLTWWHDEIARLYAGQARHPVAQALAGLIRPYAIAAEELDSIIAGTAMDLEYNRYPDFDTLKTYCRRTSGTASLISARICGSSDPRTPDAAAELGIAFRLTRMIRNVGKDARHNRIYLPLDDLARHGIDASQLVHGRDSPAFRELIAMQIDRALGIFDQALAMLPAQDRRTQLPGRIMAALCRALLEEIRADGCRVLTHRTSLTPLRKLWIAAKTRFKG